MRVPKWNEEVLFSLSVPVSMVVTAMMLVSRRWGRRRRRLLRLVAVSRMVVTAVLMSTACWCCFRGFSENTRLIWRADTSVERSGGSEHCRNGHSRCRRRIGRCRRVRTKSCGNFGAAARRYEQQDQNGQHGFHEFSPMVEGGLERADARSLRALQLLGSVFILNGRSCAARSERNSHPQRDESHW